MLASALQKCVTSQLSVNFQLSRYKRTRLQISAKQNAVEDNDAAHIRTPFQYVLDSLVQTPVDVEKLSKLSTDELVQLNSRLLRKYQAVDEELRVLKEYRYPVDPPWVQDRVGTAMYEWVDHAIRAWRPVSAAEVEGKGVSELSISSGGESGTDIVWEEATGQAVYQQRSGSSKPDWQKLLACKSIVSSALLMYRLCCLFPCDVEALGPDGHKTVWSIYLKHRPTNIYVGFSDWKAAPRFLTSQTPLTGTTFDEDWLALLNLLLHPQCPHPYDGTVAGSVA